MKNLLLTATVTLERVVQSPGDLHADDSGDFARLHPFDQCVSMTVLLRFGRVDRSKAGAVNRLAPAVLR
jgi:hypothetical protein